MNRSPYRFLEVITGLFVAVLLISNVASTKFVQVGPFVVDGGTFLFPLSYIFGDILTEVYGYQRSRRVIWTGFAAALMMSLTFALVASLPAGQGTEPFGEAFGLLLGLVPRIVLASLIAYWAGEFSNSYALARIKVATQGRHLWLRTIGSTVIGQAVDTAVFVVIAFWGVPNTPSLLSLFAVAYAFKLLVEIAMLPLTYAVVLMLKRVENEDYYDRQTNFNPFVFGR